MISFSVQEILDWVQGRLVNATELGSALDQIRVDSPVSLAVSKPHHVAFFFSRAFEHELLSAQPGVLITGEAFVLPMQAARLPFWKTAAIIACQDPYLAMAILTEKFADHLSSVAHVPKDLQNSDSPPQVHPTAVVHPSVKFASGVQVGPHTVIEESCKIGTGTQIYSGCYIGRRCTIGQSSVLFPHVTLYEGTEVGDRVRLHSGVVVGADGFGYAPIRDGQIVRGHQKIYHLGYVVIENDVEIGANSTVDRGTFGETRVGKNSKLDNLVHMGHNSHIDEGAILCGGTCLAGNASVGKYAYVGGLCGISNHVHIGDRGNVGAMTLVTKDVPPAGAVVGNPQREYREHFRAHALLSRLLVERRSKS